MADSNRNNLDALLLFVSFQHRDVQKYESISESTDSSLDLVPYNPASES